MKRLLAAVAGAAIVVPLSAVSSPAAADTAPNGQIAYTYSEFCCDTDIWVMEADGSNPRNVSNTPAPTRPT